MNDTPGDFEHAHGQPDPADVLLRATADGTDFGPKGVVPALRAERSAVARLDDAVALAGAFLAGYGSARTRAAYRAELDDFFAWCIGHRLAVLQAQRVHVELYARELEQRGRSASTVARRLSTLAGYFRYAVEEEILDRSPVSHVRRPRIDDESQTLGLDRGELARFLDAAEAAGPRDYALACLLALNGLRVSEACNADIEHLGEQQGHRTLTIVRKGNRRAIVPLPRRVAAAVEAQRSGRTGGSLLLANDGTRLDRHDAWRIVRRLTRAAGIDKSLSPHGLRHSFVTLALEAGVPLHRAQDAAGHRSPVTTRRYDRARHALDGHASYALASFVAQAS